MCYGFAHKFFGSCVARIEFPTEVSDVNLQLLLLGRLWLYVVSREYLVCRRTYANQNEGLQMVVFCSKTWFLYPPIS